MGGTQSALPSAGSSRPPLKRLYSADLENSFVLVGNHRTDKLQYDPDQTFMVSYGIDKQTDPTFSEKTLSSVTVLDAHQVCMALIDKGVLPMDHVQLFAASKDLDMCTFRGIKESFQAAAKRTGKKGLLIFHFSGHGIKVGNEWGLAPADFDRMRDTFIGGNVLNGWLSEIECHAPYVLISLDCCYAGGLANELTTSVANLRSGTYVISACTAFETSLVIGPLGHSVYAYFLSYAIRVTSLTPGILPIYKIFKECRTLCKSLTAFLVSYSSSYGLKVSVMQPELKYFDISTPDTDGDFKSLESIKETTNPLHSLGSIARYSYVTQYFTRMNVEGCELPNLCIDWIGSMTEDMEHLKEIATRGLLRNEVLDTVICLMMWSLASIQFIEDRDNVHKASHFLLAFLYTASALDSLYNVRLTQDHMKQSLDFYLGVIEANKIEDSDLNKLKEELSQAAKGPSLNKLEEKLSQDAKRSLKSSADSSDTTNPDVSMGVEVDPLESIKVARHSAQSMYRTCPVKQTEEFAYTEKLQLLGD